MVSDLNVSHEKMSDFVSFSLFEFTLVIKLRKFDFQRSLKYFNVLLYKKNYIRFENVLSTVSDLV